MADNWLGACLPPIREGSVNWSGHCWGIDYMFFCKQNALLLMSSRLGFISLMQPHLEYGAQTYWPDLVADIDHLDRIQSPSLASLWRGTSVVRPTFPALVTISSCPLITAFKIFTGLFRPLAFKIIYLCCPDFLCCLCFFRLRVKEKSVPFLETLTDNYILWGKIWRELFQELVAKILE